MSVKGTSHSTSSKMNSNIPSEKKGKEKGQLSGSSILKRIAKIDKLPKNIRETIPLQGFMNNGIIETNPGTFTKSYKLHDVNFDIAPDDEQEAIFRYFMDFINSFNINVKWEFTIFNHAIDKKKTIEDIKFAPNRDGLNKYRQEINNFLLKNLKKGNNSLKQEKYLTISIEDNSVTHAVETLKHLDIEISKKLKKISKVPTNPMTTKERMQLLYDIYNQDGDYRLETDVYKAKDGLDLSYLEKAGISIKDVIGPPSCDFTKGNRFMLGDTYGAALYLERVPNQLGTNFLTDLGDIQCNMLISISSEALDKEYAYKLVKNQLASVEAQVSGVNKRNLENGYFGSELPPDLQRAQENARDLMMDITTNDQNLFFITFTVIVFSKTIDNLEENIKLVKSVANKHSAVIKNLKFQQEFALNTALPLARNDLFVERLYTTTSAAVFIPFNAQEINQKNALFYGLNQSTKSMIMYDRLSGNNYNGLIFGYSGSGKSFFAKFEMISVLLKHKDAQVFVVDPQGEYYPLAKKLKGEEIVIAPGSNVCINPLDLDISEDDKDSETDPISMKVDFIFSLFEIILKNHGRLSPTHKSLLDKCTRRIYKPYLEYLMESGLKVDLSRCPTLGDLYQELLQQENDKREAEDLAYILYQYAAGSFDTFAHRTNVETNARFVVYNTKMLGTGLKELGLHICINDIWNRMISNSQKGIYTWFYIDEFHILLESEGTTTFLRRIWKMARKWNGVPTGIMQNTEDLLRDSETRAIINNTSFVVMLKEPLMDRNNLQTLFKLSNAQLEYITDSDVGCGLFYNGKVTVPFQNELPKNTELYKILTTSHDVEGAEFR